MPSSKLHIVPGNPEILGATVSGTTCNFALEAREDAAVSLLLYENHMKEPTAVFELGEDYRTGSVFSAEVSSFDPSSFDYNFLLNGKVVIDPCARKIVGRERFGVAPSPEDPHEVRCGFLREGSFSWNGEKAVQKDFSNMVLYKLHVRGYTKTNIAIPAKERGTFAGLGRMISYLVDLGVNAVELMPCYEFAECPTSPSSGEMVNVKAASGKINFWGYGPGNYFAPKASYAATRDASLEVCSLVKAMHQAGIAVLMEFFFPNGIDPKTALSALHFWRLTYHVDGFHLLGDPLVASLAVKDALLSDTVLFAPLEFPPEDIIRKIPSRTYGVYHSAFLEDMRRFLKSDEGLVDSVRYRFSRWDKNFGTVNYMAFQDGFTLLDMVSYNYRHNEDNGEGGQDGSSANYSWNCGVEGPTRKASIRALRQVQLRNAFALTILSRGIPLIYAGDEFGNSQKGNNNAYCQDNALGWVDWKGSGRFDWLRDFVKQLIAFRKAHPILRMNVGEERSYGGRGFPSISFHGERAWFCNNESSSRLLGILYAGSCAGEEEYLYLAFNFYWEEKDIALPTLGKGDIWRVLMCTSQKEPWHHDEEEGKFEKQFPVPPRSIMILAGKTGGKAKGEGKA